LVAAGEKFGERGKKRKKKQKKSPGPYFVFGHSAHLLTIFDHTLTASRTDANGTRAKVLKKKEKKKRKQITEETLFFTWATCDPQLRFLSLIREL
jgi:hypothetical protein